LEGEHVGLFDHTHGTVAAGAAYRYRLRGSNGSTAPDRRMKLCGLA
jgi:hypothetical protein